MKPKKMLALTGYKKIVCGVIVLLSVDLLWVVSAELSEYIFNDRNYDKPFFSAYFKNSLFSFCLLGFFFMKRWQYQCGDCIASENINAKKLLKEVERVVKVKPSRRQGLSTSGEVSRASTPIQSGEYFAGQQYENVTDDESSIAPSEDYTVVNHKVTFSKTREVRSLSKKHSEAQILARMSQSSVEVLQEILQDLSKYYPLGKTLKLSFFVCILWVGGGLMYQEALARTSAAVTNILSSSSSIFTLLFAALFPSSVADRFTVSKLLAVLVSFSGIFIICWTDPNRKEAHLNPGDLYAILGAVFYGMYLVLIKRKVRESEYLDMPLFFGFLGLFTLLIFWPGFFILHYSKQEIFELPPDKKTWGFLILNGIIGTVISEMLWLYGCFLTSSLMATLSLGLVIPLSMIWDFFFKKITFSWLFFVGLIPVFLSFVSVSILTHYSEWDPVRSLFVKLFSPCCTLKREEEETEKLLDEEQVECSRSRNGSITSLDEYGSVLSLDK